MGFLARLVSVLYHWSVCSLRQRT